MVEIYSTEYKHWGLSEIVSPVRIAQNCKCLEELKIYPFQPGLLI